MKEMQRMKKEGLVMDGDHDTDPDGPENEEVEGEIDQGDDNLFGSDDPVMNMSMDVG